MVLLSHIDTVIFDINGTGVENPKEFILEAHRRVFNSLNLEPPDEKKCIDLWFRNDRFKIFEREYNLAFESLEPYYQKVMGDAELRRQTSRPYPDNHALEILKKRGIKMAALTSAPPWIAEVESEIFGPYFQEIVSTCFLYSKIKYKPDPEGLNIIMDRLNSRRENTVYVGNGDEDILTARNANVTSIRIDRGEYPITKNREDFRIKNFYELVDLLGI